jgi:hypothetical protein
MQKQMMHRCFGSGADVEKAERAAAMTMMAAR